MSYTSVKHKIKNLHHINNEIFKSEHDSYKITSQSHKNIKMKHFTSISYSNRFFYVSRQNSPLKY